jgi:hypothetical protein
MTDKNIRGQNFNYLSLEERENTLQRMFDGFTKWLAIPSFVMWAYNKLSDKHITGRFVITVEFYGSGEVEDE